MKDEFFKYIIELPKCMCVCVCVCVRACVRARARARARVKGKGDILNFSAVFAQEQGTAI